MEKEEIVFDGIYADEAFKQVNMTKPSVFSSLYPLNSITACISTAEIIRYFSGQKCNLVSRVITVDANEFSTQSHFVYKNYQCDVCS